VHGDIAGVTLKMYLEGFKEDGGVSSWDKVSGLSDLGGEFSPTGETQTSGFGPRGVDTVSNPDEAGEHLPSFPL